MADMSRRVPGYDTTLPQPGMVALYRFYDAQEGLLYVGVSRDHWRRRKQHSVSQPWYPLVRHQAITWYDSEDAAYAAEAIAIREEAPRFNVAGAVRPDQPRRRLSIVTAANRAAVACCAFAVLLVALAAFPALRVALAPVTVASALTAIPAVAYPLLLAAAPRIRRFWAWVELSTVDMPEVPRAR